MSADPAPGRPAAPSGGLDPARVAEVLVATADGRPGRRGSGYRVGERWVLTASHVVDDDKPVAVRVRFDADRPGEWTAAARVLLAAAAADVALLEITGALPPGPPPEFPPYGHVPEADLVLRCSAMGFPRFKLRRDRGNPSGDASLAQYRDSCHATGTVSVLSNRREGTLELAVTPPAADPDPRHSPWEGMSGAAVWHGPALIGVVSAHHTGDGLGRLAATRADCWHRLLTPSQGELLRRHAGLPGPDELLPAPPARPAAAGRTPPSLAALPADLPLRELHALVEALTEVPTLRDSASLGLVLDGIRPEIAANSPRNPALRADVYGIVRTCLRYPGALDQLLDAVRMMEGESTAVARMDREAGELGRRYG
ncbi:trypsin-like peptidase domain-containing protein [Streptomyces sp. NPDC020917]|uniref:effector-associated domain 2-containing protein n=1 Tax=Streptomyces sp. NPDC020917 TaxID=3365102 RepID=UPI0037BADC08